MARTLRTTVLAAAAALAVVLTAAPAQAVGDAASPAAGRHRPTITVQDADLQLTPPVADRDLFEACEVGGLNHPFCGLGVLDVTLAGFDAHGGIPACADPDACSEEPALATLTSGTARVDVLVRCDGEWLPRVRSVPVVVEGLGVSDVAPASRVDSDTARLLLFLLLPGPSEIDACPPAETVLLAEAVRSIRLGFTGVAGGVPSWTSRVPGVHRVPLHG